MNRDFLVSYQKIEKEYVLFPFLICIF